MEQERERKEALRARLLRLRGALFALVALLYVATWPGASLRSLTVDLVPVVLPVPDSIRERDGALDVVVRAAGGGPLSGAEVRAYAILDGRAFDAGHATTDDEGVAKLASLPRAEHWVVAEAKGRARASQMVVVVAGARRLDLELGPEHVLEVRVRTETGEPVASAELEVRGGDPFPVGARTDEKGVARVGRLGEGPFVVVARAPGFEEVTRRRVPEGEPLVLTLGRNGAIVARVVSERGEPVAGARVLVASPSLFPARVAETTKEGIVRLGGLTAGSYALRAVKGQLVSAIEIGVPIAKGEEKDVLLRLLPGAMITAHVVDATTRDGIRDARVTLVEGGLSPFPMEGVADRQGKVVLGPFAPGGVTLSARADGFVARGAVKVDDPAPASVEVPLLRGGAVVGRVVDARGFPVDGATIRIVGTDLDGMPVDEEPSARSFREAHFQTALAGPSPLVPAGDLGVMPGPVPPIPHGPAPGAGLAFASPGARLGGEAEPWVSARDGTFKCTPVTPGRVRALVRHPQYVEAMSEVVQLVPEGEAKVTVVLQRGGVLEGKVVDTRGRPVASAHVTLLATRGSLERVARTGTDGSFAFASVPDALTVLVSRDEDVTQTAARLEVSVPEGGRRSVEITLPEPRPALPVRIQDDRRRGIDAAQVSAVSLDPHEGVRVTAFTDARGEAQLAGARGLALRVEVRAPGRAVKVIVTTADTATIDVELPPAESVTGEIWANRRETIEGAEVVLQTETGARTARTNKDGAFTIGDLAPGPARLRVRAKGRASLEKTIQVEARGGRRATELGKLELAEAGIVEGTVVDGRGDPVPGARVARDSVPTYLPVGASVSGMATCDARGAFHLEDLAEGTVTLEAYAPDVGRARVSGVRVVSGRTTDRVRIVLVREGGSSSEPLATGGVAVTLGEAAGGEEGGAEVVVAAVAEGSEAERGGLLVNDVLLEVAGVRVRTMTDARARLGGPVHDDVVLRVRRGDRVIVLRVAREQVRR